MSREGLAGYRLVEPIGRGAAATVYSAEYGKLRRPVAIKILHPHLVKDGSAERMLAEARTLSALDHPGIVKVFDVGTARDGRAFMVMEQLVGEPLHERLRRGKLPEERVLVFGRQLASALEVAHTAGIVHRDLKPENVFVVQDPDLPGGERVKVIDFGIAKSALPELGHDNTATGIVLGTPAYMAPERFRGCREIDPRGDVYSLGIVIYLMATGKAPFSGRDTDELAAEHEYCRPSSPVLVGVSRRLAAIIDRCLEKKPEARFASMTEVGAALRAIEQPSLTGFDDSTTFVWTDGELAPVDPQTTPRGPTTAPMPSELVAPAAPSVPPMLSPATTNPSMPPPPPGVARGSEPVRPSARAVSPPITRVMGSQPSPVILDDEEDEPAVTVPRARRPIVVGRSEVRRNRWLLLGGAALGIAVALVIELRTAEGTERASKAANTIVGPVDLAPLSAEPEPAPSLPVPPPAVPPKPAVVEPPVPAVSPTLPEAAAGSAGSAQAEPTPAPTPGKKRYKRRPRD